MDREPSFVTVAVEGFGDAPLVRRILREVGLGTGPVHLAGGKARLDARLAGYNAAARYALWLVLRDLNGDERCAPTLLQRLLPNPTMHMCFRLAVRSAEAWLMADRQSLSKFLSVSLDKIPEDPEAVDKPKRKMVDIARLSRQRAIREDMVPVQGTTAEVGPAYVSRIGEFATDHWRPRHAARRSDSLRRCIAALERWR